MNAEAERNGVDESRSRKLTRSVPPESVSQDPIDLRSSASISG